MIGQQITDRYQVLQTLKLGSITNTYLVKDLQGRDRHQCIIKQLVSSHAEPTVLSARKQLFAREVASLQRLGSHPQIPQYLNHFKHQSECYFVQEWIKGHSLATELASGRRWQESQVVQLLEDMLRLFVFVHGQGVIHRDIKPSNILYRDSDHRPVLIDFGVAQHLPAEYSHGANPSRTKIIVGTPGYVALEQASGRSRPSSDIYSLGLIAIQALTGRSPQQLPEDKSGEYLWQPYAEVSEACATVLTQMIRRHHKHRFQSATEALAAVQSIADRERRSIGTSCQHSERNKITRNWASKRKNTPIASASSYRPVLRRPLPTLIGAAAIVLATALPGIANRVQTQKGFWKEHTQQVFNPQILKVSKPAQLNSASENKWHHPQQVIPNPNG